MLTSIDAKIIFDCARLGLLNSRCRPSSCLPAVLPMFLAIISLSSYPEFLLLKRVKCPPFLFSQTNNSTSYPVLPG